MMGRQKRAQRKLFCTKLNIDQRVPIGLFLKGFAKYIDLKQFSNNGHYAKNNYSESKVFDEPKTKAPKLHKRI